MFHPKRPKYSEVFKVTRTVDKRYVRTRSWTLLILQVTWNDNCRLVYQTIFYRIFNVSLVSSRTEAVCHMTTWCKLNCAFVLQRRWSPSIESVTMKSPWLSLYALVKCALQVSGNMWVALWLGYHFEICHSSLNGQPGCPFICNPH